MQFDKSIIEKEIIPYFSPTIKSLLQGVPTDLLCSLEEIRLRAGKPLVLKVGDDDFAINPPREVTRNLMDGYIISPEDIFRTIASISDNSLYAFAEEIRRGFITIPGGHRVGLAGQVIVENYDVKNMKNFSGICFRVAREVKGCASPLLKKISSSSGRVDNTLIISPPRCGKTTILRDLARLLSTGGDGLTPHNVVIVDERSELAGTYQGIAQLDVGLRTDILDACPKGLGMVMAIRSLSPQIIITDEIGSEEDVKAINACINAGVTVITSIHASSLEELEARPLIAQLIKTGAFKRGVVLSRKDGPGTIKEIIRWGAKVVI